MSSDLQSALELLRMNDRLSRTIAHTFHHLLILHINTVVILTVIIYDYCE